MCTIILKFGGFLVCLERGGAVLPLTKFFWHFLLPLRRRCCICLPTFATFATWQICNFPDARSPLPHTRMSPPHLSLALCASQIWPTGGRGEFIPCLCLLFLQSARKTWFSKSDIEDPCLEESSLKVCGRNVGLWGKITAWNVFGQRGWTQVSKTSLTDHAFGHWSHSSDMWFWL